MGRFALCSIAFAAMLASAFPSVALSQEEPPPSEAPTAPPSPRPTPMLPCASIPVELLDKLDSGKAKLGDRVRFKAIETVVTQDHETIQRGTMGYGVIEYVTAAGAHAKPGALVVEARYFLLPHGQQYQVTVDAQASSEIHSGSNRNAPGIVGAVPLPFMGVVVGAFNYFHAGSNVVVPAGYRFAVTPVGELSKPRHCVPEFVIQP
jgi:predicted ribosome-associated RNA-binding protein Tma20